MPSPLLVVDMQNGFANEYTQHIPERIVTLIESGDYDPILFTLFMNNTESPFSKYVGWKGCTSEPETLLVETLAVHAAQDRIFAKVGLVGLTEQMRTFFRTNPIEEITLVGVDTDMCVLKTAMDIFDLGIRPIVLVDCCASTSGLQSHLAGLAVLARNIGADQLHDAGLSGGRLAAPLRHK